jgi:hypothetical protein
MDHHKLVITGKNISIDEYVTPEFARKVIALMYADENAVLSPPTVSDTINLAKPVESKTHKNTEFQLFCKENDVRRYCEIVLAVGAFLSNKGQDTFTTGDYRSLFEDLKNTKPTNAPKNIDWAIKNNWIIDIGNKTYKVKSAGRKVLKEKFPEAVRGSTRGDPKQ